MVIPGDTAILNIRIGDIAERQRGARQVATLAEVIRRERRRLGLTQEALEERSGVSQTTISQIENEQSKRIEDATLEKLAAALGLKTKDLRIARGDPVVYIEREVSPGGVDIPFRGKVPADNIREFRAEGEASVQRVPDHWIAGMRAPFVVEVAGDCLAAHRIFSGDLLVCDQPDQMPRDGQIVVVSIGDEVTLKTWHRLDDGSVELRDGMDAVVHVIRPHEDYVRVEGVYTGYLLREPTGGA